MIVRFTSHCTPCTCLLYAQLHMLSPNLSNKLSSDVSELIQHHIKVKLIHDGTAAARTYANRVDTAVITLGTALGVGFVPQGGQLRPLDQNFILSDKPVWNVIENNGNVRG